MLPKTIVIGAQKCATTSPFSSPVARPVLDAALREYLRGVFLPDLERLAALTGQPFTRLLGDAAAASWLCHNPC